MNPVLVNPTHDQSTPRTFLPSQDRPTPTGSTMRRSVRGMRRTDGFALAGALVAAIASSYLLTHILVPVSGAIASGLVTYVLFASFYGFLLSFTEPGEVVRDRLAAVVAYTLAGSLFCVLAFVVAYALIRGHNALGHLNFFTSDMTMAGPLQGLEIGGILHAIVGSLEQIGLALVLTIPLGLGCAVFLNEFPGRFARIVRTISEAMTALPSIVAGLFIFATWILTFGNDKSGFAASLALSVMMLPIIIRAADVVIRLVPGSLREASYALGASRFATVWQVVLPTCRSGLATAVILGTARGIGETSPVLLTAGFNASMNSDPTKGPQVSLPLAIFEFVKSPQKAMIERGFGTAAVLMALVLLLFVIARIIGSGGDKPRRKLRIKLRPTARGARVAAAVIALVAFGAILAKPVGSAFADGSYVPVSGAGSTWSQNALDQWRRNVAQYGMQINYQGTGSSDGRSQFTKGTVDFAVSEIPYGLKDNGVTDPPPGRPFAYMPIVAGGTSFMYNLTIGGQRVTNLRLSGATIAAIFTGKITKWNDPAVAADNPGLRLPGEAVVPVVRSDGSGTTAQFSTWMANQYSSQWNSYCASVGRPTPCGVTSFYPVASGSRMVAQSGSLGVAGFVSQSQNEGTITYVEYSYALNTGFPVAKVLNHAGYYVEPTAQNVAVGLLQAKIHPDLTQDLSGVYVNADKRAYPLSSYSYMIVPTSTYGNFTTAKGHTLGAFADYFLCEGQQQAPILGYSPLPINLVQAGLNVVRKIPGVSAQSIDIKSCNNPTFSSSGKNTLALTAPYPAACDAKGTTQCTNGTGGAKTPTPVTAGHGGTGSTTSGTTTSGTTGTASSGPGAGVTAGGKIPGSTTPVIDPNTGLVVPGAGGQGAVSSAQVAPAAVSIGEGTSPALLGALAGLALLLAIATPPLLSRYLARRSGA